MENHKYKKGDKLFVIELEYARVFPVLIKEIVTQLDHPDEMTINFGYKGYGPLYSVSLDVTPAVHDQLCFNGIVKPLPFRIGEKDLFTENMLFINSIAAHEALKEMLSNEHDRIKERLNDIKWFKKRLTENINKLAELAGLKYKIGDSAWFICKSYPPEKAIAHGKLTQFDRGDFTNKPYYFEDDKWHNGYWIAAKDVFDSKEAAFEVLKEETLAALEERCREA